MTLKRGQTGDGSWQYLDVVTTGWVQPGWKSHFLADALITLQRTEGRTGMRTEVRTGMRTEVRTEQRAGGGDYCHVVSGELAAITGEVMARCPVICYDLQQLPRLLI